MKKKAFTLFEIVLALIIFSLIVSIIFNIYINTQKSEKNLLKQQILASETNDFLDQISDLSLEYTLDYEEYFNRGVV
jgi:prepilin-type N-terminal cleavage/methylation domain-containing protein